MEKNGLLVRTFGSLDRRKVFVQLTKKGDELKNQVREKMDLLSQSVSENLTQADIEKLQEIVSTVKKNSRKSKQKDS